jgi:mannose-6-phosphate isomerase-like protein (cupin superfamily)
VLGCVLEEYASVSTDRVERLHDQNKGRPIPGKFTPAYAEQRIRSLPVPGDSRRVVMGEAQRRFEDLPWEETAGGKRVVLADNASFMAERLVVAAGPAAEPVRTPRMIAAHVLSGEGRLFLGDAEEAARGALQEIPLKKGDLLMLPPGSHYAYENTGENELIVSQQHIEPATAFLLD